MRAWLRRKLVEPLLGLLKQGLSPEGVALSLAAGLVLSSFPLVGSTTLLCLAATFLFRLNPVAIQVANFAAYPIQLALLIPFYRLGESLFGAPAGDPFACC